MSQKNKYYYNETWPTDGTDTFGYPPLETARKHIVRPWRSVRFADVAQELYFEVDGFSLKDFKTENVCACTGEPPSLEPFARMLLYKSAPWPVVWENMTNAAVMLFIMLSAPMKEASAWVSKGLSNSVLLDELSYANFHIPDEDDSSIYEEGTLTIAISYVHKITVANGLLKANDYQISQLEDILQTIRRSPPDGTKRVRLWTDQALSKNLEGQSERPNWILYGLLPYTVFTVATLYSGDESDSLSMWSACERILGDGGSGCLFTREALPEFCKDRFCGDLNNKALKSVGDGLAVNRNLCRLSSAIHSGLLDETITYHIADAQMLMKMAYYMLRPGENVTLAHVVNCDPCLNTTAREHVGFYWALKESGDVVDPADSLPEGLQLRLNKTRMTYRYPKVRARRGYVQWHGVREFLPGAGRFAKLVTASELCKRFLKHCFVATVVRNGAPSVSTTECVVISAFPPYINRPEISYIVLLVSGTNLFGAGARIEYSVRLNISDLDGLHAGVQGGRIEGLLKTFFRHPEFDTFFGYLRFHSLMPITSINWPSEFSGHQSGSNT